VTTVSPSTVDRLEERVEELLENHRRGATDWTGYRGRIEAFAEDVLGVTVLTDTQRAHLRAVVSARRVAAYGANGCGKTFDDAIIALYFVYVEDYLVVATSAKEAQLRDQFMRDVRRLFSRAVGLDGELFAMQLRRPGSPETGLFCMAASGPDNLRAYHAARVMVQVQEAQGVPDFAFESAEMMAVGDVDRVTLTGNSSRPGGEFHKRCLSPHWVAIRFNSMDHPNVVLNRVLVPGGPTRESIEQRRADYGDGPFFVASVLGDWPAVGSIDSLIRLEWLEPAYQRGDAGGLRPDPLDSPVVGLDVARSLDRDESVAAVSQGARLHKLVSWRSRDLVDTADRAIRVAADAWREWQLTMHGNMDDVRCLALTRVLGIIVDAPGIGSGVVDECRRRKHPVSEHWGWRPSSDPQRFANVRSEIHWNLRRLLETGRASIPRDPMLREEMLSLEWSEDTKGRIIMASKDLLRASLGRSPDRLDATTIALHASANSGRAWTQFTPVW
jgi:hypothetical protein